MAADRLPAELTRLADEDLLTLVERGDPDAFEVIYERHSRVAFSLAFRLLGDRPSAEDLVQDAFLAVWRGAASYSPSRGSVRNWLLSILHNRGVDRLRTLAAMTRRQEALEQVELRRPDEPDAAGPGDRAGARRLGARGASATCPGSNTTCSSWPTMGASPTRRSPRCSSCPSGR